MQEHVSPPVYTQQSSDVQQQQLAYTDDNTERVFPVTSLKIFGGIQIGIGISIGILCIIGIVYDESYKCSFNNYFTDEEVIYNCFHKFKDLLLAYDITCLVCSGWFVMTGVLPMCMSKKRQSSWRCLKIAFMICSILAAVIFVPPTFGIGVTGYFWRRLFQENTSAISVCIALLSFIEFVLSIVSASYCCCCTKWESNPQQSFVIIGEQQSHMIMRPPQTQIQDSQLQDANITTGTYNQQQHQQRTCNQTQHMASATQDAYVNESTHETEYGSQEQLIPSIQSSLMFD